MGRMKAQRTDSMGSMSDLDSKYTGPRSWGLSLQESRNTRKMAKLNGETEGSHPRPWVGWIPASMDTMRTSPGPQDGFPPSARLSSHVRGSSVPRAHASSPVEKQRKFSLQNTISVEDRRATNPKVLDTPTEEIQRIFALFDGERSRQPSLHQGLDDAYRSSQGTPQPFIPTCFGLRPSSTEMVHRGTQADGPDGCALRNSSLSPSEQVDLETLWAQLQAERTQRWKIQQKLQRMDEAYAENSAARQEIHILRMQLESERMALRQLQQLNDEKSPPRALLSDVATQTCAPCCTAIGTQTDGNFQELLSGQAPTSFVGMGNLEAMAGRLLTMQEDLKRKDNIIAQMDSIIKQGDHVRRKLHATLDELSQTLKERNCTIAEMDGLVRKGDAVRRRLRIVIENLTHTVEDQAATICNLEGVMQETEASRRLLHHRIQELKGNIRVFCRLRPKLEIEGGTQARLELPDAHGEGRKLVVVSQQGMGPPKKFNFTFDKVFGPTASQTEVFTEISQLVRSALDGCKVCLFAYGQTGSGKTYTMQGPTSDLRREGEHRGMIPLALQQILQCQQQQIGGWHYSLEATCIEIYNDRLRDLLADTDALRLQVKHHPDGRTTVLNAITVPIEKESTLVDILERAARGRAIASTKFNEQSSRSHFVFTLNITGHSPCKQQVTHGTLNIVDLAGSERLHAAPADVERVKEVQHINKSLSCLRDVISALAQRSSLHIPYRNSKLTYLLQNSLGNGAKVLMFVNISPLAEHIPETICSLRFASQVNACEFGPAHRLVEELPV